MKRTPAARYAAALAPILAYIKAHPEAKRELLAVLRRGGAPWARQQLDTYLRADARRRQEPRLGAGLALLEAAAEVMQPKLETGLKLMHGLKYGCWTVPDKKGV